MTTISVLVPTFRRPVSLVRAVESLFAQDGPAFEIVVIDNSPEGSALSACADLARRAPRPFRFGHAPHPGVATARNAALALARGDLVAFLDDDESAPPHWLSTLVAAQAAFRADVTWGPVRARLDDPDVSHAAYFERLYTRAGPATAQPIDRYHGAGNALLVRQTMLAGAAPFDVRADETGGEDDRLFAPALARGARFAWAPEAWVIEHVPAARARMGHALKRAFAYGQGPCETAAFEGRSAQLARHMATGAVQAPAFALAGAVALATGAPQAMDWLDRAARGLGKVLWFAPQKFYGAAAYAARRDSNRSSSATPRSACA